MNGMNCMNDNISSERKNSWCFCLVSSSRLEIESIVEMCLFVHCQIELICSDIRFEFLRLNVIQQKKAQIFPQGAFKPIRKIKLVGGMQAKT